MPSKGAPLSRDGHSELVTGRFPDSLFRSSVAARFTITRLGTIPEPSHPDRGVLGIFLDTSDRWAGDFGIAGSYGSFSQRQLEQILANVRRYLIPGPAILTNSRLQGHTARSHTPEGT